MVHLAIDATPLGGGWSGDEYIVRGLVRGVAAACRPGDRVTLLAREDVDLGAAGVDVTGEADVEVARVRVRPGVRRLVRDLPHALHDLASPPAALACHVHAPLVPTCPVALTITDLSFLHRPEYFPLRIRARLRALVPRQARGAAAVLTMTHALAEQVVTDLGVEPDRVHVVPTPVEPARRLSPHASASADRWAADRGLRVPFLVSIGHVYESRDRARLVYAFLEAQREDPALGDVQLVLVGSSGFFDEAAGNAVAAAPAGAVVSLDHVTADQRTWLFSRARALVYPALFEGLGLPALMAMAHGVPVVASSHAAIAEVVGDAALCVDPTDGDALAAAMTAILADEEQRARLVARGHERVAALAPGRTGPAALRALLAAAAADDRPVIRPEVVT